MKLHELKTVRERREYLEKLLKVKLTDIGKFTLDEAVASGRNCENMIGIAQIPMGAAGPLKIKSGGAVGEYYLPLATTEAALVASVNRGAKAITESGGAACDSYKAGVTRGPVFKVKSLEESDKLNNFLTEKLTKLQDLAASTSSHLSLRKILSRGVGRYRFVRFMFDSGDAMGMNMATIATAKLADYISQETGAECVALGGNFDIDKKPAWLNFIEGRGMKVWAEVTIPAAVLKDVLKTTAQKFYEVWIAKCMLGSAMSGSLGYNGHYANIVAALFAACGQDLAHVGEASLGITTAEVINAGDLYVSVYLPDLMIGTVGGGTGLATQKEALNLLGVAGGNEGKNSCKFGEIVAASVLAGEISLLSSLAEGTLARAHEKLARGK